MAWRPVHVEANQEALQLQAAAAVVRRYAGSLRYHPVTGLAKAPGHEVIEALRRLRQSAARVRGWIDAFAQEAAALEPEHGAAVPSGVRAGQQHLQAWVDLLLGSLDVLERTLAQPERAPLDAPYGLGTPRRPHPGAQATWVAERAEALARELVSQVVLRENLAAGRAKVR